jgi:N-methylhydantoinase B
MFPEEATFTVLADRDKAGPHGLFGGGPGSTSTYALIRAEGGADGGSEDHLSSKTTVQLLPGDVISYRTSGGGGYGDPFARDPIRVLYDVAQLKISVERARDRYGVVVDFAQGPETGKINEPATQELRRGR